MQFDISIEILLNIKSTKFLCKEQKVAALYIRNALIHTYSVDNSNIINILWQLHTCYVIII